MEMYPVNLTDKEISNISVYAQDYASTHGILMRNNQNKKLTNHAPFMLFPSPFPKYLYDEAMKVQTDFQLLVHLASLDHDFIEESLKSVIIHDAFTKKQYDIYNKVRQENGQPKVVFNITRSDYMIDQVTPEVQVNGQSCTKARPFEIKQIEINMIAASFGCLNTKVCDMHRRLVDIMGEKAPYKKNQVPKNMALKKLGKALAIAWRHYNSESAVVVFVVQDGEQNSFDQRHLEYSFYENIGELGYKHHVNILFRSMKQVKENGHLTGDRKLIMEGHECAVFYFRTGYTPNDFPTEEHWEGRLMMERSIALNIPNMASALIGTKKVQQIFAQPGVVERYIKDKEAVKRIRRTFAGLYSLDSGVEGDSACKMALSNPSKYVLKPQREGGGNNMYDEEIVKELQRVTDPLERSQYILMERVTPPTLKNYIVHVDFKEPLKADTVAELGVFGYILCDGDRVIENEVAGHLLRTKDIQHKDGGVAAGKAVLDSPYLV